ncbi:MAG: glycosyltransferase family 39 protein [Candidatus Eisenbacteria bacterium]|nr:glycosyltransferase family 39 protein [Candidatus Eisenbacteria bacterium]
MRINADRFQRVYAAGRVPTMVLSLALALLIWRVASVWFGPLAGVMSLAAYVLSPESLSHGSVVGDDLATALTVFGSSIAFYAFAVGGGLRRWLIVAAWFSAAFLVRFSAVQLFPAAALLLLVLQWRAPVRRPREAWLGLAALAVVVLVVVNAGYLFQGTLTPLSVYEFGSSRFQTLQRLAPGLRLPLPADYIRGLDYISFLAQPGVKESYVLGQVTRDHVVWYFLLALLVKYPVGLLALAGMRIWAGIRASLGEGRAAAVDARRCCCSRPSWRSRSQPPRVSTSACVTCCRSCHSYAPESACSS